VSVALDADAALRHLKRRDPTLRKLITQVGPFRMEVTGLSSTFVALGRSIVYQQLTGKAAATIHARVCQSFGSAKFPTPELVRDAPVEQLRACGLSGAKTAALKDLAEKVLDGTVPSAARVRKLENEAIIESLTQVRGIGRWSVEMLLMFQLGRPDVLPVGDYGVRKGFMRTYGLEALPAPKALEAHAEDWRPFRTVASWYLWRALEL